jgi:hypothetical protein
MITTEAHSSRDLDGARADVLSAFGAPTVEFTVTTTLLDPRRAQSTFQVGG